MNKLMIRHTMDKPLPYDAEVEYLESTGTQWIDTGIAYNIDNVFSFDVDSEFTTSDTNEHLCTIGALKKVVFVGKYLTEYYTYVDNGTRFTDTIVPLSTHHIIVDVFPQSQYRINGVNYTTSYYFTDCNGMSLPLFARRNDFDSINPCHAKVRHFAIYKDGINVRDFIPVRKGNTGYMYDKVSGRLFGNQGTGSFVVGPDYNPFAYQYLTFVPLEDSTFSFSKRGTGNDIEYSIDGGAWTALASEANTPTVGAGHNIRWRAELTPSTASDNQGIGTFSATGLYDAMGNTMSLLYGDNFVGQTTLVGTYTFRQLWFNDTHIYRADRMVLPATTLATDCYRGMFKGCSSLTSAPELPATTLATDCYRGMFMGCSSLTTAPALPATTLASYCYSSMFNGCTGLTVAPTLPATTLIKYCYRGMFQECTSLVYVKMLATNILASNCLLGWVSGVASTGIFVKHSQMTTLPTGASGIPNGWTVVDDPSTINS